MATSRFDPQTSLPGTAADVGGLLRRKVAAPLRPRKPQEPCDVGMFGDDAKQTDLIDRLQQ